MTPVFSVITPVYNGAEFVHRSYAMLRIQTRDDWEWVVVNDGSTDGTADLVREIARSDPRVRLVSYTPNRGRGHARTAALEASRGDWMVVWDVDDLYFPDRLEAVAAAREAGVDFCCSYALVVTNDLEVKGVRSYHPGILADRIFVHPTLACRTELAREIGYDAGPGRVIGEDALIVETLARRHRGRWVEDVLAVYREDDRDLYLQKAIDSNRGQYFHLRNMVREMEPPMSLAARVRMHITWRAKLLTLNVMRLYPRAYVWTIRRRAMGECPAGWSLSRDRIAFLERVRGFAFTPESVLDPALARRLGDGLHFAVGV
jgi:glycosyltransferase involved in cell wall biosynthesis